MEIELDERKVRYFEEFLAAKVKLPLARIVDNLLRAYLEQIGPQVGAEQSYAQFLEERMNMEEAPRAAASVTGTGTDWRS